MTFDKAGLVTAPRPERPFDRLPQSVGKA